MEALRWLQERDARHDRRRRRTLTFTTTTPSIDDARLRRTQATTATSPAALNIATALLTAKLAGQAQLARTTLQRPNVAETIDTLADALNDAHTIDEARQLQAAAANVYWSAWPDNDVTAPQFATRDHDRVPDHWFRFDSRRSLIGIRSNRKAERPLNALLNHL